MRLVIVGILTFVIFVIICAFNNHQEVEKDLGIIPPKNHLENKQYIDYQISNEGIQTFSFV